MITPEQAENLIADNVYTRRTKVMALHEISGGRIAEDVFADSDLPPFDRVMMDGVAIRSQDFEAGTRTFRIVGVQRAGMSPLKLHEADTCLEIMTGAVCCDGGDVVIPYEQCDISDGMCTVLLDQIKRGQHIHFRGTDFRRGDKLISSGASFGPAEAGICASVGQTTLLMENLPNVIIFSTGEELIGIDDQPLPHQIRRSNVFVLEFMLRKRGIQADTAHLPDDESIIKTQLQKALNDYDIILMSGGVSKGKYDLIPDTLAALGAEKIFHRIAQKPGKPMWFGKTEHTVIFGFPGNPVSTMMCAVRYLLPWLEKRLFGNSLMNLHVVAGEKMSNKSPLTFFQPAKIHGTHENGDVVVHPTSFGGSGDFASLSGADVFVEIPAGVSLIEQGTRLKAWRI